MSAAQPIRSATPDERGRAIAALTAAFVADPFARFLFPDPGAFLEGFPAMLAAFSTPAFEAGSAHVSADLRGAAIWFPPGVEGDAQASEKVILGHVESSRLGDLFGTFALMEQGHPDEPHWYLPTLGVDPAVQGAGLGSALLRHALARCDAERVPAYLESSNPRNVALYQRHGFEIVGEIQVGEAPPLQPMLRHPRA